MLPTAAASCKAKGGESTKAQAKEITDLSSDELTEIYCQIKEILLERGCFDAVFGAAPDGTKSVLLCYDLANDEADKLFETLRSKGIERVEP